MLQVITGFSLTNWLPKQSSELQQSLIHDVVSMCANKVFIPQAGQVFPLQDVQAAINASLQAGGGGKVLLKSPA